LLALSTTVVLLNAITYAVPVTNTELIEWDPDGQGTLDSLKCNPEWLKVEALTTIDSDTWVIVKGKDCLVQNIEAKVLVPEGTQSEDTFPLIDQHSGEPVPFSEITDVIQQQGTHCNSFRIHTLPVDYEEYLGHYHRNTGWEPGDPDAAWTPKPPQPPPDYYHTTSSGFTTETYPPEPSNPDPIKIVIDWDDENGDLTYDEGEEGDPECTSTSLIIEGIGPCGSKLVVEVPIDGSSAVIHVGTCNIFSTICKISGGCPNDSYYIFTEPEPQRPIFTYHIRIDHVTLHPECYTTFAHPTYDIGVVVALRDIDGNLVRAPDAILYDDREGVLVNLQTTGGTIRPSNDLWINPGDYWAESTLYPDTNARDVKVTAVVNVPEVKQDSEVLCPALNLIGWTDVCFQGVSSVYFTGSWPIEELTWGYGGAGDSNYPSGVGSLHVPPLPWLPETPEDEKLNGRIYKVYIPLVPGCNLISTPIHPMLCDDEKTNDGLFDEGIPLDVLFGPDSSATQTIEAIWTHCSVLGWIGYVPGVGYQDIHGKSLPFEDMYFKDGNGYWVKAEKPCTIVVGGIFMENAPFVPPTYPLNGFSWNLMGVTSLDGISIKEYLESVSGGAYTSSTPYEVASLAGPVWVYKAKDRAWFRNPAWGLWPTEAFWVFNKLPEVPYLAP